MVEPKLQIKQQRVDRAETSILRVVSILSTKNIFSPEEAEEIGAILRGENPAQVKPLHPPEDPFHHTREKRE